MMIVRLPSNREARPDDEAGFAGGLEGLIFGVLIFMVGTLFVANIWGVVDTKYAVDVAAREAGRTYVEAPDSAMATAEAEQAADSSLRNFGRNPARAHFSVVAGGFQRCERITIEVTYEAPLFSLPFLGSMGSAETVSAKHSELVDPYRTGLPGQASCAT